MFPSTYLVTSSTMALISSPSTLTNSFITCQTTQYNSKGSFLFTSQATLHIHKLNTLYPSPLLDVFFTWWIPLSLLCLLVSLIGKNSFTYCMVTLFFQVSLSAWWWEGLLPGQKESDNENIITIRTISNAVLVHDNTATALDLPDTAFDVGMIDSESIDTVTSEQEKVQDSDAKLNIQTKTSLLSEKQIDDLQESEDERQYNLESTMQGEQKQEYPVEEVNKKAKHHHGPSLFDCKQGCFTNTEISILIE
jgi:hypothetical protein